MAERVKQSRRRGYTRLSGKRQVTLPIRVVDEIGLTPGDELKVETIEGKIVLSREEGLADRRRKALAAVAGSLPGVYEPGYLERLRDEWA